MGTDPPRRWNTRGTCPGAGARLIESRTTFDGVGLSLFPIDVPEGVVLSDMFMGLRRFGAPMVFGGTGTEIESQEAVRMVAFEWPTAYTPTVEKTAKELQHLNRFNVDIRAETRRPLYSSIERIEDDPPDFRCITQDGRTRGVECTQLVLQERLEAEARFRRLRRALLGTSRHRLQHLQGHVVYVALEPRASEPKLPELVSAVTSGLEQHDPTIGASLTELPEQAPEGIVTKFAGGTIASAPLNADPGTFFSSTMGFELALSNASYVRHRDAWKVFGRLVREHDAEGVDDLVVSAEAPTADGFAYPSDAVLAQALIDEAHTQALSARHVAAVYLHVWGTSGVFKFTPGEHGCETICGVPPV